MNRKTTPQQRFYAFVIEDSWQKPQRLDDGTPHNFAVVSFDSVLLRTEAKILCARHGYRLKPVSRKDLFHNEFECPHYVSFDAFLSALASERFD